MDATPDLFSATVISKGDRLLVFPRQTRSGVWAWSRTGWTFVGPLDGPTRLQCVGYSDPQHGIVLVGWERKGGAQHLVRWAWNGAELDRHALSTHDVSITSCALDPVRRRLVLTGGAHGTAPWTLAIDDGRPAREVELVTAVAYDPLREGIVAVVDVERTPGAQSAVPPVVGLVEGDRFTALCRPWGDGGARRVSALVFDEALGAVVGFFTPGSGVEPSLHALQGEHLVPVEPEVPAPPLNLFGLVRHRGELIAWGGQNFEGDANSLWRRSESKWRELQPE